MSILKSITELLTEQEPEPVERLFDKYTWDTPKVNTPFPIQPEEKPTAEHFVKAFIWPLISSQVGGRK